MVGLAIERTNVGVIEGALARMNRTLAAKAIDLEPDGDPARVALVTIRFELARFITDARSVLGDGAAEKAALHRVYDLARGEAATAPYLVPQPSAIRDREKGDDSLRGGFGLARAERRLRGALDGNNPEPKPKNLI